MVMATLSLQEGWRQQQSPMPEANTSAPAVVEHAPEATPVAVPSEADPLADIMASVLANPVNIDDHVVVQKTDSQAQRAKPYTVWGQQYTPFKQVSEFYEEGVASWYGPGFHGRKTANGERFDQYAMTAAHKELPINSIVRVTRLATGDSIVVRINDRGPFHKNRVIDLSYEAAKQLGIKKIGKDKVKIELIGHQPKAKKGQKKAKPL